MSGVSFGVDPKTAQRLRTRRTIVVDADAARAQAFAQALQQSGAAVATVTPADKDHHAAHALDADVLLVNEDEPEPCRALVLALRQHPRTRWSTVLPISFATLWPSDADQPDVASIADQMNGFATALVELTVRAKGKLPHDRPLEPLGPSRSLRALGSTGRNLRMTLSDERVRAELELTEGRVGGVLAWIAGAQAPLSDVEALSVVLAMSSGQLHIEEPSEPALSSWNVELTAALASAAAISERGVHPTVPQLSFAEILAEASAKGRAPCRLPAPETEPKAQPERVSDQGPAHAHAMAAAFMTRETYEPPIFEERARATKPIRVPARTLAMAFTLLGTSALALALQASSGWRDVPRAHSEHTAASYSASLARMQHVQPRHAPTAAQAQPAAPQLLEPAEPQASAEPVLGTPAHAAPAPREPSRRELEQAKRIVKRAHHYLRNKRYDSAVASYTKVLALVPTHVIAMRSLVRIHLRERNVDDAVRWAQRLVELEPDSSVSQLLLGDAHALSGDAARAEQAWQRSSALGSEAASKRTRPR